MVASSGGHPHKKYRQGADLLRRKLKQLGFYPLQRSLWFYPYNPVEEIEYISNYFGIGQFVTIMEICKLDIQDAKKLEKYFKASNIL